MPAGTVWPAMNGLHLYSFSTRVEPRSTACAGSSLAYELVSRNQQWLDQLGTSQETFYSIVFLKILAIKLKEGKPKFGFLEKT